MAILRRAIKVPLNLVEAIDLFIAKSKGFYRIRSKVTSAALDVYVQSSIRKTGSLRNNL